MADADWITDDLLRRIKQEVDQHPSRIAYLTAMRRGLRHYRSSKEWWIPLDTLDDMDVSKDHPNSRENRIRQSILEVNSVILKNDPLAITHPHRPVDADISDQMDKVLRAAWRNANTRHVLRSMKKMSMIGGLEVGKVGWNPANKKLGADGDVQTISIPAGDILFDPYAPNDLRGEGCRYILHTTRQTPESIIYRYGDKGAVALGLRSARGKKASSISRYMSMLKDKLIPIIGVKEKKGEQVDRRIAVEELWLFPLTVKESDLATGTLVDEKVYPYGVVSTFINNGRVRLMPNPFVKRRRLAIQGMEGMEARQQVVEIGHKLHPFVLLYWVREHDENGYGGIYDCAGTVEHQIPIAYSYNKLSQSTEINAQTTANPGFTYIEDALAIPAKRITLGPGEGIPINAKYAQSHSQAIQFHPGKEMPAYIHLLMEQKRTAIDDITGLKPGMIGLSPQGTSHTDAAAIGTLQEASFSGMWTPTEELMACIEDISRRYLGNIQQYYKLGRFVDIGEEGESDFLKIQAHHLASQFSIEVVSGTTTPIYDVHRATRQAEIKMQVDQALATQNADMLMSAVVYLRNLRYPYVHNWIQLLLRKIEELKMEQQSLQQLGGMGIAGTLQGAGGELGEPAALPPGGEEQGFSPELAELAADLGVSPDQLIEALSE